MICTIYKYSARFLILYTLHLIIHDLLDNALSSPINVKNLKNILDEAQKTPLDTLSTWYSFFNMKADPFFVDFRKNGQEFFTDQEEVVKTITFDIGVSKRGVPMIELLIGPTGSGKSTILYYIHSSLKQLSQEDPTYSVRGGFMSVDDLLEGDESEEEADELNQKWIKFSAKKYDYFLFDDADSTQVPSMMRRFVNTNLKLFSVSPKDAGEIQRQLSREPNLVYVKPLQFNQVRDLLDARMKKALVDTNSKLKVEDIFETEALRLMVKFCFGVPKLILRCASIGLEHLRQSHVKSRSEIGEMKITKEIMEFSCKKVKCYQAYKHYKDIRQHKYEILTKIIETEKTPTEISSEIQKDRTTISRHLGELKEIGLVDQYTKGRESYYKVTEPVKILMEIESLPKGVWNHDSS